MRIIFKYNDGSSNDIVKLGWEDGHINHEEFEDIGYINYSATVPYQLKFSKWLLNCIKDYDPDVTIHIDGRSARFA